MLCRCVVKTMLVLARALTSFWEKKFVAGHLNESFQAGRDVIVPLACVWIVHAKWFLSLAWVHYKGPHNVCSYPDNSNLEPSYGKFSTCCRAESCKYVLYNIVQSTFSTKRLPIWVTVLILNEDTTILVDPTLKETDSRAPLLAWLLDFKACSESMIFMHPGCICVPFVHDSRGSARAEKKRVGVWYRLQKTTSGRPRGQKISWSRIPWACLIFCNGIIFTFAPKICTIITMAYIVDVW